MATSTPWIFLQNPILNATDNSYRLAVRISTYHMGALQKKAGDTFFDGLITTYTTLHNAFITAYNSWKSQTGLQQGQTLNVAQLLRLLSNTKAGKWDRNVQDVYDKTTPTYLGLFPNGRSPFQQGNQTDRIAAVKALSTGIGSDASLATVKADVDAFYTLISTALTTQKGAISGTKTASDTAEATRVTMCIGQYANLGALIQHYAATPNNINQYFDLAAIRNGQQVLYTGDTQPLESETIVEHTFVATDGLKLENEGDTDLQFYLAAAKNAAPGALVVTVPAHTTTQVTAADLGDVATLKFLNVYNHNTTTKGDWTIEFI